MKILKILTLTTIITSSGCASTGLTEKGETAYFEAQKQAASEPIMSISCPDNGCQFKSLTVNNPGNNQIKSLRTTNPALEITKTVVNAATSVAPWVAVSHIAVEGIANASGNTSTSSVVKDSNNNTDTTNVSTTETTETVDSNNSQQTNETNQTRGDTFGDSASVVGRDSVGDNSGQNAGVTGRINSDNSDSTSTPTVVEQPEPTVVNPDNN